MSTLQIMGYNVEFPYPEPYDIQKLYMEKVINCLHNKVHGVLESPTGTGKTLCLLAPVSAWMRQQKASKAIEDPSQYLDLEMEENSPEARTWSNKTKPIVWYTARTHSQIAQSLAELRRCSIQGLNIRVLGARDQLCINPDVLSEKESYIKTLKCKELTRTKSCKYYRRLNHERDPSKFYQAGEVMDIEDLVTTGRTCGVCPYYLSKLAIEKADIVFLPYNYIIDRDSRVSNGLHLKGDVVIFDEGHNVPNTCEESYEFSFSSLDIALGIKNFQDLMQNLTGLGETAIVEEDEAEIARHAENSVFLLEMLYKMEKGMKSMVVSEDLQPVSTLYNYLEEAGITFVTASRIQQAVDEFIANSTKLNLQGGVLSILKTFEKMVITIFCSTVRSFDEETIDRSFKCGISLDQDRVNKCKRISLYCFNPSFGIRSILQLGVKSIIITSGTLSPLRTFIHELNLPRPVTLQNGHIAKNSQVPFFIIGTGINNVRMDAAFTNRHEPAFINSLGLTLTNLINSVPDGILLLFSSYSMMQNLKEVWEGSCGVWKRLNSLKRVFQEPRGKDEFIMCMENYKRAIDSGNGAILMGVLRGKISEGMDFKDQYCRAVFIIGVPFPPTKDPRVKGKEKYAESLLITDPVTKKSEKLYTNSFMSVEAMKATNQAIGRVIRHGQDYGAIVLVDYRFSWSRLFLNISPWLRGTKPMEKNYPQAKKLLVEFFKDIHSGKLGVPEIRCQPVDKNGSPIAGYVTYEEYEPKKTPRPPVSWIKAEVLEEKVPRKGVISYIDESTDNISSLYSCTDSQEDMSPESSKKSSSVFDALDHCKTIFPGYGELSKNGEPNGEVTKRKFEDDKETSQSIKFTRMDKSSKTVSNAKYKVPSRVTVKPFFKAEGGELEEVAQQENFMHNYASHIDVLSKTENRSLNKDEDRLKINLLNYFKSVKSVLSEDDEKEFKKCSFLYMKNEKSLGEMIALLDRIFRTKEKKFYSGFGICVKSKDRDEWEKSCRLRQVRTHTSE